MSPATEGKYLVSAIVSTYNAERFLRGKLEDLEAQTIAERLEIIVIDSCSPQNERAIVAEFQERYDNIRYLRTDRRETVYQAWNRGIRMASGEFVANANTDDRLRRDAYEVLVRALRQRPECVLAYPDMRITQEENQTFEGHRPYGFRDWPPYSRHSLLELCCVGPFPLWRRSLHDEIGYFDERYRSAADYEFWLRASERHEFVHVPEFLGLYWLSEETVSRRGDLPTLEYLQVQKEYRARFAHLMPPAEAVSQAEDVRFRALVAALRSQGKAAHDAAGELERFIEQHPDFPEAHHELAQIFYRRGEIGFAKKHFEKAVLLAPESRQFADSLQGFLRLELYQSLQLHTAELAARPDDLDARLSAGMICLLLERFDAARAHYRKALQLAPDNPLAQGNLAYLEIRQANKPAEHISMTSPPRLDSPSPLAGEGRGEGEAAGSAPAATSAPAASSAPVATSHDGALASPPLRRGDRGDFAQVATSFESATALNPPPPPFAKGGENTPAATADPAGYFGFSRPEVQRMVSHRARRILDVGCAEGKVGAGIKSRQGAEAWGIEPDPTAAGAAAQVLDRVIAAPLEKALEELPDASFDSIILADVLEHLADPAAALAGLSEKLSPTGELIVSLPNVGHWSVLKGLLNGSWDYQDAGILDRTHLRFFTRKSALELFAAAGFHATEVTPIALSGSEDIPAPLLEALSQAGIDGPELARESGAYQYLFRLARPEALITSIVILTYNELDCTRECLDSIARNTPEPHEIILVDNGSTDGTVDYLRELCAADGRYRLVENGVNLGFAAGCNIGMRLARGGNILLLNNDVVVPCGWLGGLLECLQREPGAGLVGPMSNEVAGPQQLPQASYRSIDELEEFARGFARTNAGRRIRVPRLVGFCLLFTREVLDKVGELDVSFGSGNFEDDDFCLRASLEGFGCVIAGDVFIHHYGSRSFKANGIDYARAMAVNRKLFDAKWDLTRLAEPLARRLVTHNAINEGRKLAAKGSLTAAVDLLLERGIRFSPAAGEPYRALAEILVEAGKFKDALEVLEEAPDRATVPVKILLGRCHGALGHGHPAHELAAEALRRDPESAAALHLSGTLALGRGETGTAEEHFRAALAADPGYGPSYGELAALSWERGARDEGLQLAELAFILSPLDMSLLARYHRCACSSDALPREEARLREARALFPEHQGLAFGLIEILIRRGEYRAAMTEIERAAVAFGMDDAMIDAALAVRERVGVKAPEEDARALISLCMIVKDEARHLPVLLHSAGALVDEIVVVDTGSSDRTADIARIFGARVFSFPWNGSFSDARNYSLEKASCEFILVLDADEALAAADIEPLRSLAERSAAPTAYSFTTRNYTEEITRRNWTANTGEYPAEERGRGWTPSDKVRLFPNDRRLRFQGAVHELLEPTVVACGMPIHACDVPVHHYGRLDAEKTRQKQEQYYLLGRRKIAESGADPASLSELARQATELQKGAEAFELWHRVLEMHPENAEAHFNLGYLHLDAAELTAARKHALRAAELAPDFKEAAFNLAKCELFLGLTHCALERSQDMLQRWPDYPPALSLYCAASQVLGLNSEAQAVLSKLRGMGFDSGDFLNEYASGLKKGGREDLALPLVDLARQGAGEVVHARP